MRIAMLVTAKVAFPMRADTHQHFFSPLKVALEIAEGIAAKGHEVTFFGPEGSHSETFRTVTAPIPPLFENAQLLQMEGVTDPNLLVKDKEKLMTLYEQYLLAFLFKEHQRNPFDLIHLHVADIGLPFGYLVSPTVPVVYTVHELIFPWRKYLFQLYQDDHMHFVGLSDDQRSKALDLRWAGTVYNGTDLQRFPFSATADDELFFLGRLLARKGVAEAIAVAQATDTKLTIAGGPDSGPYWEDQIQPHLRPGSVEFVGFVPYDQTHAILGRAKAVLNPIQWDEPFGLVMTEAMACGTPVIAFARGAAPEIIEDGRTGFLVNSSDTERRGDWVTQKSGHAGLVEAIGRLKALSAEQYQAMRQACRSRVEAHFSVQHMVDGYEGVYRQVSGLKETE